MTTRWTVTVSDPVDRAMRMFLAERGSKKGDISKFVEETVQWRLFEHTVAKTRAAFAAQPPDELQKLIDNAWGQARNGLQPTDFPTQYLEISAGKSVSSTRAILDTRVLLSTLLMETSPSAQLLTWWRQDRFNLLMTAAPQFQELQRAIHNLNVGHYMAPELAFRLSHELWNLAIDVKPVRHPVLQEPNSNQDPYRDALLASATAGQAKYLVIPDPPAPPPWHGFERPQVGFGIPQVVTVSQFLDRMRRPGI